MDEPLHAGVQQGSGKGRANSFMPGSRRCICSVWCIAARHRSQARPGIYIYGVLRSFLHSNLLLALRLPLEHLLVVRRALRQLARRQLALGALARRHLLLVREPGGAGRQLTLPQQALRQLLVRGVLAPAQRRGGGRRPQRGSSRWQRRACMQGCCAGAWHYAGAIMLWQKGRIRCIADGVAACMLPGGSSAGR